MQEFLRQTFDVSDEIYQQKVRFKQLPLNYGSNESGNREKNPVRQKFIRSRKLDPAALVSYDQLTPMHQLWLQYIDSAVFMQGNSSGARPQENEQFMQRLLKADWHGSVLEVEQAKNPVLVGLRGIVVQELAGCFLLTTQQSKRFKTVPKKGAIFRLIIERPSQPIQSFRVYGNQILCRSADRSTRKWKDRPTIELL